MPVGNPQFLNSIPVARWAVELAPSKLQVAKVWPFQGVAGRQLDYAQVPELTPGNELEPCAPVPDASSTIQQGQFQFSWLVTRYRVCHSDEDRFQTPLSSEEAQYPLAIRALNYGFFGGLDAAAGSTPLALRTYIGPDRTVDAGGAPLSFNCISDAYHRVDANDGRPTVIMSATPSMRAYENLCRNAGFEPPKMPWTWYNPATGRTQQSVVTAFNGTPWLINDRMEGKFNPASAAQRIYFMVLGDDRGSGPTRGVTAIVPNRVRHDMFVKRVIPAAYDIAGGNTEPIAATDVFISWAVGIAVGSPAAISVLQNFQSAPVCSPDTE